MTNKEIILNHDYGYGKNIHPSKIKKLYLKNITDLKIYVKDIIYKNIIENKNIKLAEINKQIIIEKVSNKVIYK